MSDAIQKRGGLPIVRPAKAALDGLRKQANHQKIYGVAEENREDLFVCFDISSSMLDPVGGINNVKKVTAAINAAEELVRASQSAQCRMGLVVYGTGAKMLCPQTENYRLLLASIAMIKPDGWTEIGAGLQMCAERLGSSSKARSKRIILLTDGLEMLDQWGESPVKAPTAMEVVNRLLVPHKIVVDCVAFGREADLELLNSIAKKTGGKLVTAYQEIELKKAFLQLETGVRGLLTSGK